MFHYARLRVRLLLNWFLRQVKKLKKGGRAVTYSPDGSSVAVGQNDGGFLILDSESLEKIVGFKDRKESISDIKFSPGKSCFLNVYFSLIITHGPSLVGVAFFNRRYEKFSYGVVITWPLWSTRESSGLVLIGKLESETLQINGNLRRFTENGTCSS